MIKIKSWHVGAVVGALFGYGIATKTYNYGVSETDFLIGNMCVWCAVGICLFRLFGGVYKLIEDENKNNKRLQRNHYQY